MTLTNRKLLQDFKNRHPDAASHLDSWEADASEAHWAKPSDVKERYNSASILSDNCVIFNIRGNRYRLKVQISYKNQIILIKKVGTHDEYMTW